MARISDEELARVFIEERSPLETSRRLGMPESSVRYRLLQLRADGWKLPSVLRFTQRNRDIAAEWGRKGGRITAARRKN